MGSPGVTMLGSYLEAQPGASFSELAVLAATAEEPGGIMGMLKAIMVPCVPDATHGGDADAGADAAGDSNNAAQHANMWFSGHQYCSPLMACPSGEGGAAFASTQAYSHDAAQQYDPSVAQWVQQNAWPGHFADPADYLQSSMGAMCLSPEHAAVYGQHGRLQDSSGGEASTQVSDMQSGWQASDGDEIDFEVEVWLLSANDLAVHILLAINCVGLRRRNTRVSIPSEPAGRCKSKVSDRARGAGLADAAPCSAVGRMCCQQARLQHS